VPALGCYGELVGGLVYCLVGVWLASAHGPEALARHLDEARAHLPLAFADAVAGDLVVSLRQSPAAPMARYLPATSSAGERLQLHGPFYLRGATLVPVAEMPIDIAEYYFNALLEAHLQRQIGHPGTALGREIRQRAAATMTDVPLEHRVEAYVDALASFGSHLLSVANELERKHVQRASRGGLCPLLDRDVPLLRLWERIFSSARYPGAYLAAAGSVRWSRAVLTARDKQLMLESVLGSEWNGSVHQDLAPRYCAGQERGVVPLPPGGQRR
jgi:hypothetical protein